MPDPFPDTSPDPSSEEQAAQKRAMTLGLVTAGLGILAQPRFRGEPASIPIARGALSGIEAYTGALSEEEKAREEHTKEQQLNIYREQEIEDRRRGLDIQQQNADALKVSREAAEKANAPVGDAGVQMIAQLRNDPATAPLLKTVTDEQIKNMPYARWQSFYGDMTRLYGAAHNPATGVFTMLHDDPNNPSGPPVATAYSYGKTGGPVHELVSGSQHFKAKTPTENEYRRQAVVAAHPEYEGHPDLIQAAVDAEKLDNASQLAYNKAQENDKILQEREKRQLADRKDLATFTSGLKSQEAIKKALLAGVVSKGGTNFSVAPGVNPASGKPAIKYTPMGFSPFTKPVFVDLPGDIPGGMPSALTPPGRRLNLAPDTLAALKGKVNPGESFRTPDGKMMKRLGDDFYDVTNPPPGTPSAPPATLPDKPVPASAPAPAAPAAAPTAAPAPAAAPSVATAATPKKPPELYRDPKSGKPLWNPKTGKYLYVDENGDYVDERGFPIRRPTSGS